MPKLLRRHAYAILIWLTIHSMSAADMPFRAELTVNFGSDRGQNLGTLFEVTNADGQVVAGAGFQGVYNTYVRGERTQLQFFIRTANGPARWTIERLPPIQTKGTGFYPLTLGGQLHVYPSGGPDRKFYRWDADLENWRVANVVDRQIQMIAGKPLWRQGEQLIYDGVTLVDAQRTQERIGEYYYADNNLFVRQFRGDRETGSNRIVVYPWVPETNLRVHLAENSACAHRLSVPYEFFYTFGQWQDHLIGITNVGTVLRFKDASWQVLREPNLSVSYQVYCGINFHDKLLLGQYPRGTLLEYAGGSVKPLDDWPPVMNGVADRARELQTATIYGGELYVGVWPWAELWRFDADQSEWQFVQRMFEHPTLTDEFRHPYEAETKAVNAVANIWGQRITGLMPLKESLIITTSSKGGQTWEPRFAFLSESARADYGAIYRATLPGNLTVTAHWKPKPTTFAFVLADDQLTISQDGRKLGTLAVDAELQRDFQPANIRWGEGVFGACTGTFARRESTVAMASLPPTLRSAYLHPDRVFEGVGKSKLRQAKVARILDEADLINLNALFPFFTSSSGQAHFPSTVAPHSSIAKHDPLKDLVHAMKSRGKRVYPVICVAACGNFKPAGVLLEHPEWGLRQPDGSPLGYLSPAHSDARDWIVRIVEEILDRYEPDGILLDYVRFHNRPLRLDVAAEERFESSLPENCSSEERQRRFQSFKEAQLTTWVRDISRAVRRRQPNAALGIYCWGPHTVNNHLTAQVWPTWVATGDVDFVNVSGYYHRAKYGDRYMSLFRQRMSEAVAMNQALPRQAALSFALGVKTSHGSVGSAKEIAQYVRSAHEVGMSGFAYFAWDYLAPYMKDLMDVATNPHAAHPDIRVGTSRVP